MHGSYPGSPETVGQLFLDFRLAAFQDPPALLESIVQYVSRTLMSRKTGWLEIGPFFLGRSGPSGLLDFSSKA
ncbi:MAG: hypothetical protein CSA22_00285 [Deltaproteobacteria bacterium]|nr:MAG: hypothetical protein CSA22_00285 [Deltaproteobacteria bacterium]